MFHVKSPRLMRPTFSSYVSPILMYSSQAWNPILAKDIYAVEAVQRCFTKSINSLRHMEYKARLKVLGALRLQDQRLFADMVLVFKAVHGLISCSANQLGLRLADFITYGDSVRLEQKRSTSHVLSSFFSIFASSV